MNNSSKPRIKSIKTQFLPSIWLLILLFAFSSLPSQTAFAQTTGHAPSPSYSGPLYAGDSLFLIANPPGEGPYYFNWTGPNGFFSSEENPFVGIAQMIHAGIYTLQMFDNYDNESTMELDIEVEKDSIGLHYEEDFPSANPPEFFCATCVEEGNGNSMPSPPMVDDLSKSEKQTRPNVAGPPSCETEFNSYTGNFIVREHIISISGLGPKLSIDFIYNSCNSGLNFGYGNGWTFNYNLVWERIGSDVHLYRGDGREDTFLFTSGSYISPAGISDTLINIGDEQFLLRSKYGLEYYFSDSTHRRLTKVRDRNNNELILEYTDSLVTTINGACGRSLQFEYSDGQLIIVKDENPDTPRLVYFEYDPLQNLRKIKDPLGYTEDFIYDVDHKIIQLIDKRRNIVEVEYNSEKAVMRIESAISQINVSYDQVNNQTIVSQPVDGSVQTTTYSFDAEGRAIQIDGSCCGYDVQYQYNSSNDIIKIIDARGLEYNYVYDDKGNLITATDPLNMLQHFQYDPQFSQLVQWTDNKGNITSSSVDAYGNVTSVEFPGGFSHTYSYYDNGLLKTSINGEGHTTSLAYNGFGNRTSIARPIGKELFGYDEIGNLSFYVTPNGDTTSFEYDAMQQRINIIDPLGNSIEKHFDPNGNEIWTNNKRGDITTRTYDAHNRLIKLTQPLEIITSFSYDEKDNLISKTDPNGSQTLFTYNLHNQMTSETNALGNTRFWEYDANGNIITKTNFRGFSNTYTHDELNRRITTTDAIGNTTNYQFDANGNNTSISSPDGVASTFQYDEMNLLIETHHPFYNSTIAYDKNGNIIEEKDALDNSTTYKYDANDRLTKITDALGQEISYQYDETGNRTVTTDKMGNARQAFFNALNQTILTINALGDSIMTGYDQAGNQISISDERSYITEYSYDELNRKIAIHNPIGTLTYFYDKNGNTIQETDVLGRITTYEYDAINQLIKTNYADGSNTRRSYDKNGNTISITNEVNGTDRYTYNELDRLAGSTNAENETTLFTYDNLGNKKAVSLSSGNVIRYVYDIESRLIASYDKLGRISKYSYDLLGNIVSESDGNGYTFTYVHDPLKRKISSTDPKGDQSQYTYNPNNNLIQYIDREGNITTQNYDESNRLVSQTDALGNTTAYSYDKAGNLTSITDANGNKTEYDFDENNRLITETYANGTTRVFTYDKSGNVISKTDNSGIITSYEYDMRNRLIIKDFPGDNDDNFAYDAMGRLITAHNAQANLSFGYDKTGRLLFENLNGYSTNYTYDVSNQMRTINYPGGNQLVVETSDKRGRLKQLQEDGNIMATWYYDGSNRPMARIYSNGSKSHFTYNKTNWITSLQHSNTTGNFVHLNYAFDAEGNKQVEERIHRANHSESYEYDDTYRLTGFQKGNITTGTYTNQNSYDYDPLGNRQQVTAGSISTAFSANEMNEYTSISGMPTPVYDANGNLTSDGIFTYQYDYENRLISVDGGSTAIYEYDPLGRRINKITVADTAQYFFDGARVIEEKDNTGNSKTNYLYGIGIDDILVMQKSSNTYYYHKNSLGSVAAITNSSGFPVEYYEYDPYGKVGFFDENFDEDTASVVDNPYLFTGRRLDTETGLYYYRARYYDSFNGRFLQRDPLGYADGMNLYQYTGSNPVNRIDPLGLHTNWTAKAWQKIWEQSISRSLVASPGSSDYIQNEGDPELKVHAEITVNYGPGHTVNQALYLDAATDAVITNRKGVDGTDYSRERELWKPRNRKKFIIASSPRPPYCVQCMEFKWVPSVTAVESERIEEMLGRSAITKIASAANPGAGVVASKAFELFPASPSKTKAYPEFKILVCADGTKLIGIKQGITGFHENDPGFISFSDAFRFAWYGGRIPSSGFIGRVGYE